MSPHNECIALLLPPLVKQAYICTYLMFNKEQVVQKDHIGANIEHMTESCGETYESRRFVYIHWSGANVTTMANVFNHPASKTVPSSDSTVLMKQSML